jgi:hypothetical protein
MKQNDQIWLFMVKQKQLQSSQCSLPFYAGGVAEWFSSEEGLRLLIDRSPPSDVSTCIEWLEKPPRSFKITF